MKRFRLGMESDDEDSLADGSTAGEHCQQQLEMPPAKSRRQVRPLLKDQPPQYSTSGSTSGFSSSSVATDDAFESTSDIFYIYNAGHEPPVSGAPLQRRHSEKSLGRKDRFKKLSTALASQGSEVHKLAQETKKRPKLSSNSSFNSNPGNIAKHSNLDTLQGLKLSDQFRLAIIRYLNISNGIRLALLLFCLGYFLYNAFTIYKEYSNFDTIIYLEYRQPNNTYPPAITVCTHCLLCNISKTDIKNFSVIDILNMVTDKMNEKNFSDTFDLSKMGIDGFSVKCTFVNSTMSKKESLRVNCSHVVKPVISIQEGRYCVTYFSDLQGQMRKLRNEKFMFNYDYFPQIELEINGTLLQKSITSDTTIEDDENTTENAIKATANKNINPGLFITVGDPGEFPLMEDISFHKLQDKKIVDIRFQKKIEILKKPPFETKCFDYTENLYGKKPNIYDNALKMKNKTFQYTDLKNFRSRGECILFCLWGHINDHDCVNIYSIFNFDLIDSTDHYFFDKQNMRESFNKTSMFNSVGRVQFCDYDSTSLKEYQSNKRKCLDHCNKACLVESYSMDPNILDYGSDVQNGTNVVVSWSPENYVFIRHNERMDQFWFLGNIGGQLHIWLSLSVISVIQYLINLVKTGNFLPSTSCCCLIYWWKLAVLRRRREDISVH